MANNVYIGMRYVPIFDGDWDATKSYEALIIVQYGNNTYTSKKPVPVGTLPTNTNYWVLTGNLNGQIADLDSRVDAIEAIIPTIPTNRKFVLVGDSFGCGVRGGGLTWVDGWIDYFASKLPGRVFYYDPASDPTFPGTAAFTSTTENSFLNLLNYVYNNKLGDTSPEEITDIVVIGGSNELSTSTADSIAAAIDTFVANARTKFPNADIRIAAFGLDARMMANKGVYQGYRKGAQRNACGFGEKLFNLGTKPQYNSGYGHFSAEGYQYYNPIIAEYIASGDCHFNWYELIPLTLGSDVTLTGSLSFVLVLQVTSDGTYVRVINTSHYRGWYLRNNKAIGSGTLDDEAFTYSQRMFTWFSSGTGIDNSATYFNKNNHTLCGQPSMALFANEDTAGGSIHFTVFPWTGISPYTDAAWGWNGTILTRVWPE